MLQRFNNESAETLADYTTPSLLVGRSPSCTPAGVVSELCALLHQQGRLPDATAFYNAVAMDATGLNSLEDLHEKLRRRGKHLVLSAPHTNPLMVMEKAGFIDRLGRENVCPHIDAALERAREILGLPPAEPTDPNYQEKQKLEAVRLELASALDRVNTVLKSSARNGSPSGTAAKPDKTPLQLN